MNVFVISYFFSVNETWTSAYYKYWSQSQFQKHRQWDLCQRKTIIMFLGLNFMYHDTNLCRECDSDLIAALPLPNNFGEKKKYVVRH